MSYAESFLVWLKERATAGPEDLAQHPEWAGGARLAADLGLARVRDGCIECAGILRGA